MAVNLTYDLPYYIPPNGVTTIIIRPPERLVIETSATGGYQINEFKRNGLIISDSQYFFGFGETYLVGSTTAHDLGVYTVSLRPLPGQSFRSDDIQFLVVEPGSHSRILCFSLTI